MNCLMHLAYLDETYRANHEHSVLALVAPPELVPVVEEKLGWSTRRDDSTLASPKTLDYMVASSVQAQGAGNR